MALATQSTGGGGATESAPHIRELNVSLADGYDATFKAGTLDGIEAALRSVNTAITDAETWDDAEARDALNQTGDHCKGDYHERVKKIKERKSTAWTDVKNIIDTKFKPHSGVVDNLMDSYRKEWSEIGLAADKLNQTINDHLRLDEWMSEGAKAHKQAIAGQSNALAEFQQLSYDSGDGCTQVAQINGAIFLAAQLTLENLATVQTKKNGTGPVCDYQNNCDKSFYVRTDNAASGLEAVRDWLNKLVDPRSSDWAETGDNIGISMAEVQNTVNNLQSGGVWPQASADNAKDAKVDEMASHTKEIDDQKVSTKGDGTTF